MQDVVYGGKQGEEEGNLIRATGARCVHVVSKQSYTQQWSQVTGHVVIDIHGRQDLKTQSLTPN